MEQKRAGKGERSAVRRSARQTSNNSAWKSATILSDTYKSSSTVPGPSRQAAKQKESSEGTNVAAHQPQAVETRTFESSATISAG